ncbi:MAG: chromosome segregation protein SMC [Verrucomicrobiota bacterium]|nr:chromosome segregation protein SMC [Verrucomicrobiota bacterium]
MKSLFGALGFAPMYLKTLSIQGFKSFADKTDLHFPSGVTAIVGPNGCGKSNVLDSLRWVLGEQSAKALRGSSMQDVIFNGTDTRKPLGMAEVALTFSDCGDELGLEYNEVTICRRVYRDGASEYEINKVPSRLKDIQQLFMDTGVGRSAYSIMEQGKIDKILSAKPEDRREVFEEAAGITRYKSQKKEALRRLEYTEANLLRLTDIVKEVRRQIGSLQRQAGKARRYKEIIEKLRVAETRLARLRYEKLSLEINEFESSAQSIKSDFEQLSLTLETQETQVSDHRSELDLIEQRATEARQQHSDLRHQIDQARSIVRVNAERISEAESLIEQYRIDISGNEEKINIQESSLIEIQGQLGECLSQLTHATETLRAQESRVEEIARGVRSKIAEQDTLRREIQEIEKTTANLQAQATALDNQFHALEVRRDSLTSESARLEEAKASSEIRLSEQQASRASSQQNVETLAALISETEAEMASKQSAWQDTTQKLNDARKLLADYQGRMDMLAQLAQELEGYSTGTQSVLKGTALQEATSSLCGTVADHIKVAPDFIKAVESSLDTHLQTILVRGAAISGRIIEALKNQKLGLATLKVLDLPDSVISTCALPEGGICWLNDKIQMDDEVTPFLRSLLGHTVLVADIDSALRLRAAHAALDFVTLSGETVSRLGVIRGGETGEVASTILTRKALQEELNTKILEVDSRAAQFALESESLAEQRKTLGEEVSGLRGELRTAENDLLTKTNDIRHNTREIEEHGRRLEQMAAEVQSCSEKTAQLAARKEQISHDVEAARVRESEKKNEFERAQAELSALSEEESTARAELMENKVTHATIQQRKQSLETQEAPIRARVIELNEAITNRQSDIGKFNDRVTSLRLQSDEAENGLGAADEEIRAIQSRIDELGTHKLAVLQKIEAADNELKGKRRLQYELQTKRGSMDVQIAQKRMILNTLSESITKKYQVKIEEIQLEMQIIGEEIPSSMDDLQPFVDDLQAKIDDMGPVNIEAIAEYDDLEKRHDFLTKEFNDLEAAKANLCEAIAQINKTTEKMFTDTFHAIKANFQTLFVELFGGGKANLILADENDPLECGIDIVAKPPGKQLQSISLLSGGERTMTAVALLFSMYMVKPSPFCVLDEMDAPLDESNINRFIKILKRFVGQSQFLLITHNKRTISIADVLYGVTMQESGVSRLVSVKFNKSEVPVHGHTLEGEIPTISESMGKPLDTPQLAAATAAAEATETATA